MKIKKVGILQGVHRMSIQPSILQAAQQLRDAGCEVLSDREEITLGQTLPRKDVIASSDVLIVCGGDGSILNVARYAAVYGVPVLGANFGQLGFLSEVGANGLSDAIPHLLEGDFTIEERLMLCAQWQDQVITALNDIVVRRDSALEVIRADVHVDNHLLDHYVADGILVSTPTGASAYALSCGGPIVHPKLKCMTMTAICPHSLRARPVMLATDQEIRVNIATRSLPAIICADGQDLIRMTCADPVIIKKAPVEAKLIRFSGMDFFSMVHEKLVDRTQR